MLPARQPIVGAGAQTSAQTAANDYTSIRIRSRAM
jgi:hypothetical protein